MAAVRQKQPFADAWRTVKSTRDASPAYPRAMSQAPTSSQLIRTLQVGSDIRFKMGCAIRGF
jgi:hypothetical protein